MATLRIEHAITDYETWRAAFERAAPFREQAGVRSYRITPNRMLLSRLVPPPARPATRRTALGTKSAR